MDNKQKIMNYINSIEDPLQLEVLLKLFEVSLEDKNKADQIISLMENNKVDEIISLIGEKYSLIA